MKIEINLDFEQIDKILVTELEWHALHAEDLEDVEALRRVLHYFKGGVKNA